METDFHILDITSHETLKKSNKKTHLVPSLFLLQTSFKLSNNMQQHSWLKTWRDDRLIGFVSECISTLQTLKLQEGLRERFGSLHITSLHRELLIHWPALSSLLGVTSAGFLAWAVTLSLTGALWNTCRVGVCGLAHWRVWVWRRMKKKKTLFAKLTIKIITYAFTE